MSLPTQVKSVDRQDSHGDPAGFVGGVTYATGDALRIGPDGRDSPSAARTPGGLPLAVAVDTMPCARQSNTSLPGRRGRWPWWYVPSASPGRG
jgi:hypothetical protein